MILAMKAIAVASFILAAIILFWLLPRMRGHAPWHVQGLNIFAAFYTYLGWEIWRFADGTVPDKTVYLAGNALSVLAGITVLAGFLLTKLAAGKAMEKKS